MKKLFLMVMGASAAAVILSGCATVNTSGIAAPPEVTVSKDYTAVIEHKNVAAKGEATVHSVLGIFTWGVSSFADEAFNIQELNGLLPIKVANPQTVAKQGATYNALKGANADVLIGAKYCVDTMDYFVYKKVECKVSGFPGVVKGVK